MLKPTDYFNQPLNVGDTVVYPIQRGSSGAGLNEGTILSFIELVPHPSNSQRLVREDHLKQTYPTSINRTAATDARPYVVRLSVATWQDGKYATRSIKNVGLLVKGPA